MSIRHRAARAILGCLDAAANAMSSLRRLAVADSALVEQTAVLHPQARIVTLHRESDAIIVGAHTHIRGELLVAAHGGRIRVGNWCYVGDGSRIWSADSIEIGDRVLISHACEIHDWNAHSLDAHRRHEQFRAIVERGHPSQLPDVAAAPIRIGDDAWIGFGSAILKGVTIGPRSVVAARSLVLEDVPADVLVAGSPARVVKRLDAPEDVGHPFA